MPEDIKLTDAQNEAVEKGKQIGFYIAGLDLPDEEKEKMLSMLSEMNPEQLDIMLGALEKNYLAQAGKQADDALKQGLEKVAEDYSDDMRAAQEKANKDLDALASSIK